jgi:hypothetical protein
MSYRIQQLAVGNFFLQYVSTGSTNKLREILHKVTAIVPTDDEGARTVIKTVSITLSDYGGAPTFGEAAFGSEQVDLQFAPISGDEAFHWIGRNKVDALIEKSEADTRREHQNAMMRMKLLNEHFSAFDTVLIGQGVVEEPDTLVNLDEDVPL